MFNTTDIPKSSRIPKLIEALYAKMPVIESARAKLITESYKATEGQPVITRRAEHDRTERMPDIPGIFLPVAGG